MPATNSRTTDPISTPDSSLDSAHRVAHSSISRKSDFSIGSDLPCKCSRTCSQIPRATSRATEPISTLAGSLDTAHRVAHSRISRKSDFSVGSDLPCKCSRTCSQMPATNSRTTDPISTPDCSFDSAHRVAYSSISRKSDFSIGSDLLSQRTELGHLT